MQSIRHRKQRWQLLALGRLHVVPTSYGLRRAESISLRYYDVHGVEHEWPSLRRQEAELLQHELDHLDGVLAVDRAEAPDTDIVPRDEYLANRAHYDRQVDFVIVPTV